MANVRKTRLFYRDYYVVDPDTGYIGNGKRNPTQPLDIYNTAAASMYCLFESSGDQNTGIRLKTSVNDYRIYVTQTDGELIFDDATGGTLPFRVEQMAKTDLLALRSAGYVTIGGGLAASSGGRIVLTTGTYNGLDVADTLLISFNMSGNITINDFTNGANGQVLILNRSSSANTLTITHGSGSNQSIYNNTEASLVLSNIWSGLLSFDPTNSRWTIAGGTT